MIKSYDLIIIGGGAAGFFAAINTAISNPKTKILILEKSNKLLSKVKISGGGRCNVTNKCFEPGDLVKNYPRGNKELRSVFEKFNPSHTIDWFKKNNVELVAESDGRMFPFSNTSQTIIDCFLDLTKKHEIEIIMSQEVMEIDCAKEFLVKCKNVSYTSKTILLATGGFNKLSGYHLPIKLRHKILSPVPSLFTFNTPYHPVIELQGLSVKDAEISLVDTKNKYRGPLLITHWGFSGPVILKLSAFAALDLFEKNYRYQFSINWLPNYSRSELSAKLNSLRSSENKTLGNLNCFQFPNRLWHFFISQAQLSIDLKIKDISNKQIELLVEKLSNHLFDGNGKTTYKEEFVTSGGINLKEIDFRTMESKIVPNLFVAGEVLNIDGITGGFNFQAAWSTSYIAAQTISGRVK